MYSHEKSCTCPGSNRRPLACEASVITTTLQVPARPRIYLIISINLSLSTVFLLQKRENIHKENISFRENVSRKIVEFDNEL